MFYGKPHRYTNIIALFRKRRGSSNPDMSNVLQKGKLMEPKLTNCFVEKRIQVCTKTKSVHVAGTNNLSSRMEGIIF